MRSTKSSGACLRFGLVGAGRIAQAYAEAFGMTPRARLTGICDVRPEAAEEFAGQTGCAVWPSVAALADSGTIDAAIVATPPNCHAGVCSDFLRRGIPVLCEKPVSCSVESAREIRRIARVHGTQFTMASKFRYAEEVKRARDMVDSGILGDIVLLENTFMSYVDMGSRWNSDHRISGGGVWIDNGTHSVDILRYFLGPLIMIHAIEGPKIQGLAVEETVHVVARSAQGAIGRMDLSWSISKQCDDYISIYGSRGVLRVGWKGSYYRQAGHSNWTQFGNGYNKIQAFCDQISNFSAAIQGIEPLVIDADDAVASVEAVQTGYESMARDSWTPIENCEIAAEQFGSVTAATVDTATA